MRVDPGHQNSTFDFGVVEFLFSRRAQWFRTAAISLAWVLTVFGPVSTTYVQAAEAPAPSAAKDLNVIFISLTNTRADHLGAYGYSRDTSANIDKLARKSLVFRNAFSHASWTLPVAVSLLTSRYPFEHGLMNREEARPLPAGTPTFVDVLREHGYVTAAFVGDRDYSPKFGHTSHFSTVFDAVNEGEKEDWRTYGVLENTLPPARDWLRRNKGAKFFLLIQAYDTHCPFAVPKEIPRFDPDYKGKIDFTKCYWTFERTRPLQIRTPSGEYADVFMLKTRPEAGDNYEVMFYPQDVRHMIALYDGEIYNADQRLGSLFDEVKALGLEEKTIIVFYADHGDMFGKHGRFMRGGPLRGTFYDDVLRIPLIIYHPGISARSIDGLAQVIDIGPTLLDLLGFSAPDAFRGKSLKPLILNSTPVNDTVFAGSSFTPSQNNPFFQHRSVIMSARNTQWKLISEKVAFSVGVQDEYELYDLKKDPNELNNVMRQQREVAAELKEALAKWTRDIRAENVLSGFQ